MKKALQCLFIFTVIISFSCFCSCDEVIVRDWSAFSGVNDLKINENMVAFNSSGQFPLLASKNDLFINANKFSILQVKMRTDKSYLSGRLFFRRIGDTDFNMVNAYELQTGLNNAAHNYIIDLSRNPNWHGVVMQLMFSPGNSEGAYQIAGFKLLEPSFPIKTAAIGQEFFTFEVPQLRTYNFMYGPRLKGTTVNLYIYYLIFVLSLLVLAWDCLELKDIRKAFISSSKKIIVICLVSWMVLDMRVMFDQARSMILDIQIYGGKSLEEKRALTTPGDLNDYLTFVDLKLPKGSSFKTLFTSSNYYFEKALYYLYPRRFDENSDFVIVYDPYKSMDIDKGLKEYLNKGYRVFAFIKEGELILKR